MEDSMPEVKQEELDITDSGLFYLVETVKQTVNINTLLIDGDKSSASGGPLCPVSSNNMSPSFPSIVKFELDDSNDNQLDIGIEVNVKSEPLDEESVFYHDNSEDSVALPWKGPSIAKKQSLRGQQVDCKRNSSQKCSFNASTVSKNGLKLKRERNTTLIMPLSTRRHKCSAKANACCEICSKELACMCSLRVHMKTHRMGNGDLTCAYCKNKFNTKRCLITHIRTHWKVQANMQRYDCKGPGKQFCKEQSFPLQTQVNLEVTSKPHSCEMCGNEFSNGIYLRRHVRRMHKVRTFRCEVCDVTFSERGALNRHKDTHMTGKSFSCEHCGTRFVCALYLRKHIRKNHRIQET